MITRQPDTEIIIPEPDTSVTDYSTWPPEVWTVIAGLLMVAVLIFIWQNISDKMKFALVIGCGAVLAALLMK